MTIKNSEAGTGNREPSPVPISNEELGTALRSAIQKVGWDKSAEVTGKSVKQLKRYAAGAEPPFGVVVKIAKCAGLSLDQLVSREEEGSDGPVVASPNPDALEGFVLLPRYDVRASLGAGTLVDSEQIVDHLAFKEDWVRLRLRRNPADLVLIEASGDSMDPTIRHGDLLLLDIGQPELRDNAIYALQINGGLIVKRIQRLLRGGVVVRSDNDRYEDEELSDDEASGLKVIGQVIWHGGIV